MEKVLLNALQQTFPGIPKVVIKEMVLSCGRIQEKYIASGKFLFSVTPQKINSLDEITGVSGLGYDSRYKSESAIKRKLFAKPASTKPEELTLVYTGGTPFLGITGYEVIKDAHPSLLIGAAKILTREIMREIGIPDYVTRIVLPTSYRKAFINKFGKICFASVNIQGTQPLLTFTNMTASGNVYAVLLRKVS